MPQSQQEHSPTSALTERSIYLQSWLLLVLLLLHTQTEDMSNLQKPQSSFCLPCPQDILEPAGPRKPHSLCKENSFHKQGESSTLLWVGGWSVSFQPLICLAHAELGGGDGAQRQQMPAAGLGARLHLAEGELLDQREPRDCSEPQLWLCWQQDQHRGCCRALGCSGNP